MELINKTLTYNINYYKRVIGYILDYYDTAIKFYRPNGRYMIKVLEINNDNGIKYVANRKKYFCLNETIIKNRVIQTSSHKTSEIYYTNRKNVAIRIAKLLDDYNSLVSIVDRRNNGKTLFIKKDNYDSRQIIVK